MDSKAKTAGKWLLIHFPEAISGVALVIAVFVAAFSALSRYFMKWTVQGYDEITIICFAWAVFPGAAAAMREGMHYGVDLIVNLLPKKIAAIVGVIVRVLIFAIMCILAYLSVELTATVGTKIFSLSKIPYFWFDLSTVVGFGLMTVYSGIFMVKEFIALPARLSAPKEVKE